MKATSKAAILRLTRCSFYVNIASAPLLIHVSKKDLRIAFKNTQRTHFTCEISEYFKHNEKQYYTVIILL